MTKAFDRNRPLTPTLRINEDGYRPSISERPERVLKGFGMVGLTDLYPYCSSVASTLGPSSAPLRSELSVQGRGLAFFYRRTAPNRADQ